MARSRSDQDIFEISLPAVVDALNKIYPLPMIWADDAGALYRKARQIFETDPDWADIVEEHGIQKYLAEGMTDGEVMALTSIIQAMAAGDAS